MSENRNCGTISYARYDSMTDSELEELLRLDAMAPDGEESDTDALLYIMGVLADRRKNNGIPGKTAQESYESFKQHYLTDEATPASPRRSKCKSHAGRWLREVSAAAAVIAVILLGSVTVRAMGFDLWEAVVTWAQETFHFGPGEQGEPAENRSLQHNSLQEAISVMENNPNLVPTWIPDGYELVEIQIVENPLQRIYFAVYQYGDKYLKIAVQVNIDSYPEQIEQSDGYISTVVHYGINYYIFMDNQATQAAWINGPYECYISGELTIDQLTKMIHSINED